MKYLNDNFKKNIKNNPKYHDMILAMQKEVDSFASTFKDDPNINSEWGHYYFCNNDGGRLIFDLNKPHTHVCEVCHKEFKSEIYDGVWVYFYRNTAILTIWKAACLYKALDDKKYLDIAKNILNFYAENYTKFKIHNKERQVFDNYDEMTWGCGRILPQGLNESIIAIRMISALEILRDDLDKEFLDNLYFKMFREMFYLLKPQVNQIHNIRCWNNSAIGVIGLYFNDLEMIDFAFNGPFNIRRQLREGVTSNHFWYEGSIHYNFFTLEGVINLCLFAKLYGYDFGKELEIVHQMFIEAYHYAFNNGYFPNPNDGWPNINLKTYDYIYQIALKVFGEDDIVGDILKNILANPLPRTTLPLSKPYYYNNEIAFERLLLNSDVDFTSYKVVKQETKNYETSQFGLLRNDNFNIFFKYGLNGPSHAHPDIMNIEITYKDKLISRDMSNPGYQSKLYKEWFKKTISHNTVCSNGKDQEKRSPGECLRYDSKHISASSNDVYNGIDYKRSITLDNNVIYDEFVVKSKKDVVTDYFFHLESDVKIINDLDLVESNLGFKENGYEHILNCYKVNTSLDKIVLDLVQGDYKYKLELDLIDKELYLCKTMDNPVNKIRLTLVVRSKALKTVYHMKLEV